MASVLETFLILFESNADDVKKGASDANKTTTELNDKLLSTKDVTSVVGASFVQMAAGAAGAIAAVLSLGALTQAMFNAADYADQVGEFSDKLGLNVEDVSAWGDALQVNGGDAASFRATVEGLATSLTDFAVKGKSRVAPFFEELGIKMVDVNGKARNVMEVLPELAESFEKLSKQESAALGQKLGLDQGTIMLLQRGRREVEDQIRIQKELGVVTAEQAEIAGKYNDTVDNTAKVFRSIFGIVSSSVLPILTRLLESLQAGGQWIQKHTNFVVGLMIALGVAITTYAIPPLLTMAAAVLTAFAPFILMGVAVAAAAAAFALLYDDVMAFIDGNDSLIGQILTQYPIIGAVIGGIADVLRGLWDTISWVFNTMLSLLQISAEGWRMLGSVIGGWVSDFVANSTMIQGILSTLTGLFDAFGAAAGGVWDWITDKIRAFINVAAKGVELVKSAASFITGSLDSAKQSLGISQAQDAVMASGSSPLNSATSNVTSNTSRSSNKTTSIQTGPITVQTNATDGQGVAAALGSSLSDQMRQAAAGFDDGVLA